MPAAETMARVKSALRQEHPHYGKTLAVAASILASGACTMNDATAPKLDPSPGNSRATIVGRLTDEGAECWAVRADDGQLYTLLGDVGGLVAGTRVCVSGERLELSTCQQGITIRIQSITSADHCESPRSS